MIQGKSRNPRQSTKRVVQEPREQSRPVAATGVVAVFSPGASVSFAAFCFPTQFFDFCCRFALKMRMNMARKDGRFHSLASLKLTQTVLERTEEGERRSRGSNGIAAKSKDFCSSF